MNVTWEYGSQATSAAQGMGMRSFLGEVASTLRAYTEKQTGHRMHSLMVVRSTGWRGINKHRMFPMCTAHKRWVLCKYNLWEVSGKKTPGLGTHQGHAQHTPSLLVCPSINLCHWFFILGIDCDYCCGKHGVWVNFGKIVFPMEICLRIEGL
jgi:hypothetical protein